MKVGLRFDPDGKPYPQHANIVADTFTDSLARLTGDEQKAVKTTAFDLQMNLVNAGMQLHKLERQKFLVGACERRYSDHRSQVTTGHSYREYA